MKLENSKLLLSDRHGIYIPKTFAESFEGWGIADGDRTILITGPEHEWYWETWDSVLNYANFTQDGVKYYLYQDGDLWAVPEDDYNSDDEYEGECI